uniref:Protein-O-fucosyltransferase 2 n=1 Tax=Rhizophora mucronata TaxID=61149 RepID=A0A2P2LYA3_RHIMU
MALISSHSKTSITTRRLTCWPYSCYSLFSFLSCSSPPTFVTSSPPPQSFASVPILLPTTCANPSCALFTCSGNSSSPYSLSGIILLLYLPFPLLLRLILILLPTTLLAALITVIMMISMPPYPWISSSLPCSSRSL